MEELKILKQENKKLQDELDSLKKSNEFHGRIKKRLGSFFMRIFIGWDLKNSVRKLFIEIEKGKINNQTLADVATHTLWRFTRIGMFAIFAAILPSLILGFQAYLLKIQYNRLEQQTYLQEAERRSSLVFLFNNVMDKIDEELKDTTNKKKILSPQLISRITSLSRGLKPYNYLENDEIIEDALSPERGQLLVNLAQSELNGNSLFKIFRNGDFSFADLKGANLPSAELKQVNLFKADLSGVMFSNGEMIGAKIYHANLTAANFMDSDLRGARLNRSNLHGTNFREADLRGVNFENAIFGEIEFTRYQSLRFEFEESHYINNEKIPTSFWGADLRKAKFLNNDFTNLQLDNAKVKEKNWFETLEDKKIKGLESTKNIYTIETKLQKDESGEYYVIKKK